MTMTTAKSAPSAPAAAKAEPKAAAPAPARKPAAKPAAAPKAETAVAPVAMPKTPVDMPKAPTATEAAQATSKQAADAAKVIDEAVAVSKQTVENVVKAGTDTATKTYEKAVAVQRSRVDAVGKASDEAMKSYEASVALAKDNVDALLASGAIMVKGMQDMTKIMLSALHEQLEENLAYGKALAGCRSLHEVMELNQSAARSGFDCATDVGTKISATSAKVLEEAVVPLTSRITATVDRFAQPAAR